METPLPSRGYFIWDKRNVLCLPREVPYTARQEKRLINDKRSTIYRLYIGTKLPYAGQKILYTTEFERNGAKAFAKFFQE